jgi:hypothetical protein
VGECYWFGARERDLAGTGLALTPVFFPALILAPAYVFSQLRKRDRIWRTAIAFAFVAAIWGAWRARAQTLVFARLTRLARDSDGQFGTAPVVRCLGRFHECLPPGALGVGDRAIIKSERLQDGDLDDLRSVSRLDSLSITAGRRLTNCGLDRPSPFAGLRRLTLHGDGLSSSIVPVLADMNGLWSLDLSGAGFTDVGLTARKGSRPHAELRIRGTRIGDAGLQSLTGAEHFICSTFETLRLQVRAWLELQTASCQVESRW